MYNVEMSVRSVLKLLPEAEAREFLIRQYWPVPTCTKCGQKLAESSAGRFYRNQVIKCPTCNKKFFATGRTVFHAMKISFKEFLIIRLLFDLGIQAASASRLTGRTKDCLAGLYKKFRLLKSPENERF